MRELLTFIPPAFVYQSNLVLVKVKVLNMSFGHLTTLYLAAGLFKWRQTVLHVLLSIQNVHLLFARSPSQSASTL